MLLAWPAVSRVAGIICSMLLLAVAANVHSANNPHKEEDAVSTDSSLGRSLVGKLESLVASLPPGAVSSILVTDAGSGQVIYEKSAHQNMLPASVLKVLTAVAAYEALGGDFRFSTRMLTGRPVGKSHVIKGGLLVAFNGDPSLEREHIDAMLAEIKKKGIREIEGPIWLDGSIYEGYPNSEGVSWNDLKICFAASSTAMILDRNCFYALLKPNQRVGRKAVLEYARPGWPMRIDNQIVTTKPGGAEKCPPKSWPSSTKEYRLEGCMMVDDSPLRLAFAVKQPEHAVKKYMVAALKRHGIIHRGRMIVGHPDKPFEHLLVRHDSAPLSELLTFALERSDNLYMDSVLKMLGHQYLGKGSYESGVEALTTALERLGSELGSSHIEDGSGLSRYNLISARALNSVLSSAWQRWGQEAPWLETRRQQDRWFKTGTMNSVRSIVGYVFPEGGVPKVFVIMLNGVVPAMKASDEEISSFRHQIRTFQHEFIDALLVGDKASTPFQ